MGIDENGDPHFPFKGFHRKDTAQIADLSDFNHPAFWLDRSDVRMGSLCNFQTRAAMSTGFPRGFIRISGHSVWPLQCQITHADGSHGQSDSGGSFTNPVNACKQKRVRVAAAFQDLEQ